MSQKTRVVALRELSVDTAEGEHLYKVSGLPVAGNFLREIFLGYSAADGPIVRRLNFSFMDGYRHQLSFTMLAGDLLPLFACPNYGPLTRVLVSASDYTGLLQVIENRTLANWVVMQYFINPSTKFYLCLEFGVCVLRFSCLSIEGKNCLAAIFENHSR